VRKTSNLFIYLFVLGTLVYAHLRTQKTVVKCITESELIALSDNVGLEELFHNFVSFVTHDNMIQPVMLIRTVHQLLPG
jgi:hypothetical protein